MEREGKCLNSNYLHYRMKLIVHRSIVPFRQCG
jgi:hypothetical protein